MTALWLFPALSVPKGQFSWGMPVWAKNSENVKELLRLNRSVQGVSLEFVAIDRIVHISTRVNNHLYLYNRAAGYGYAIVETTFSLSSSVAYSDWPSPSSPPLTVSLSSGLPMRVNDWWLQVKHFGRESSDKRSLKVLFKSLSPSPTSVGTAWSY